MESMLPAVMPKNRFGRPNSLNASALCQSGLRDDADTESLRLEQPAHDGHAEAGVIHIRIAGDDDHVAGIPKPKLLHLGTRHGQERRDAETCSPYLR